MNRLRPHTDKRMAPTDLGAFWREHPSFLWGPALLHAFVQLISHVPTVAASIEARGSVPYGLHDTALYTGFAIILAYASHAFFSTHVASAVVPLVETEAFSVAQLGARCR